MNIDIFGVAFHPYGFVLGIAILAGLQASLWLAKRRKIPVQLIEQLFWWVVIGGIIGARAYHVIDKWQEIYSLNPQSVFYLWNGGLGIWGAVIGGILVASIWYAGIYSNRFRVKLASLRSGPGMTNKVSFLNLVDVVVFGMPLGQAIGRWGNFFNNEIVGKNGEPLFLYESALDLILFGVLVWIVRRDSSTTLGMTGGEVGMTKKGMIAGVYLIGYGLIRFLLEPLRPEAMVWKIGTIPTASIVSLAAIATGIFLISWRRRS